MPPSAAPAPNPVTRDSAVSLWLPGGRSWALRLGGRNSAGPRPPGTCRFFAGQSHCDHLLLADRLLAPENGLQETAIDDAD